MVYLLTPNLLRIGRGPTCSLPEPILRDDPHEVRYVTPEATWNRDAAGRLKHPAGPRRRRKVLNRLLEHPLIKRVSFEEYRQKVRHVYDGPQGAMLATCSLLSLHSPLGERLFRERKFDLRGAQHILDVGSGAGQLARHLLKYADPESRITCFDLSHEMLRRAHAPAEEPRPRFVVADLTRLPFPDATFDCVTCGYVLEHLPDARLGLERAGPGDDARGADAAADHGGQFFGRVDEPASGAAAPTIARNWPGFAKDWACTGTRNSGIREMHKVLRAGGICVELVKALSRRPKSSRLSSRPGEFSHS